LSDEVPEWGGPDETYASVIQLDHRNKYEGEVDHARMPSGRGIIITEHDECFMISEGIFKFGKM